MVKDNSKKTVLGLTEEVTIRGKSIIARIDTGAQRSSIGRKLAEELQLGPIIKEIKIRSSTGREKRPVVEAEIILSGRRIKATFNIANRARMKYPMLIGQEILKQGFLIDPTK